jgi:hypothetical protein
MQGYDVVTHDDEKVVGHVVDKVGGNYIVEQGHLRKTKHALPEEFATVDEAGERIVILVPKDMLSDSPKVNGDVDEDAVRAHYGLNDTSVDNPSGYDDHDLIRERIAAREGAEPTDGIRESPALLGDRLDDTVADRGTREPG